MHLKTLTLRGFKSFASSTTLRFEPGITCVVGPNGSGKSNVVDALAWVMGEQGVKSLRGGKMEDVIFAGTAGRPPLGRAEVVLTIDNADGALPIDYTEVTISRIMFRNGGSEYAINGSPCRLLDIQELLSDSGIGREMHVVVGQGQLDAVLSASPEDRRGFIEEAAGVLKHRKRKEKALRKLEAMQANLTRLTDLTAELGRQLKPLGRQAEVARRAAVVQAEVRDARLRLLADDLLALRSTLEAELADETALRARRAAVEVELDVARRLEADLERSTRHAAPALAQAQESWYRLSALRDRLLGTAGLAAERMRHLRDEPAEDGAAGGDPERLEAEAAEVRRRLADLTAQVEHDRLALTAAVQTRESAEDKLAAEERRLTAVARAAADRREGLARLSGQVNGLRTRAAAAEAEVGRLTAALEEARQRTARALADFAALESRLAGLDEGESGLDAEHARAVAALEAAENRLAALREQDREAERDRAALRARVEALGVGLRRNDGAGALLAAGDRVDGVLGAVAAVLTVEPGYEAAVAAALGALADGAAVSSVTAAVNAIRFMADHDAGRVALLVAGQDPPSPVTGFAAADTNAAVVLPPGARPITDVVSTPDRFRPAVEPALRATVVVADLGAAHRLVSEQPSLTAVTRAGDLLSPARAAGGSATAPSLLKAQAALEDARSRLCAALHCCERLRFELGQAEQARADAQTGVDAALSRLHESDSQHAAIAEQLGHLAAGARAAAGEADRLAAEIQRAEHARDADLAGLAELEQRLAAAESSPADTALAPDERDQLAQRCLLARQAEVEARLALRTGEERAGALAAHGDALTRSAAQERAVRERAAARRARRAREATVAAAAAQAAHVALTHLSASLEAAAGERQAAEQARTVLEGELLAARARVRELAGDLEKLTDTVHRDEVARAEQRLRVEQLEQRALDEHGIGPETLFAEYGPDCPVPPAPAAPGEERAVEPEATPYVRVEQEKRLRSAERALALLGRVNPLALEEFTALEERHCFLTEQLADLKASRRGLLDIVREVDARVEEVFTAAFTDTAREFEAVFARLFPGGHGRLLLTDPADMLTTGIEVEARPPGKQVKRLSLLSGGERSLTAVALLVAIFRARPSPFYVLDEVEAALDDVNLQRLLGVLEELRASSQLIVITHQKRTMEIADALYGTSMRGDGVTALISQRLREAESA